VLFRHPLQLMLKHMFCFMIFLFRYLFLVSHVLYVSFCFQIMNDELVVHVLEKRIMLRLLYLSLFVVLHLHALHASFLSMSLIFLITPLCLFFDAISHHSYVFLLSYCLCTMAPFLYHMLLLGVYNSQWCDDPVTILWHSVTHQFVETWSLCLALCRYENFLQFYLRI